MVRNDSISIDGASTEPVYKGKTFSHWLTTATHDRDDQTRINSIKACRATAETDQQLDSLLLIFNQIVRERGTRFVGGDKIDDGYLAEIGYALQGSPANKAFNFICNEIKNGNKKSREFCSVWVQGLWLHFGNGDVSYEDILQHLQKVERAVPTLLGPITENLQEPGVIELLNAVLQPFDWLTDSSDQNNVEIRKELSNRKGELFSHCIAGHDEPEMEKVMEALLRTMTSIEISQLSHTTSQKIFREAIVNGTTEFRCR